MKAKRIKGIQPGNPFVSDFSNIGTRLGRNVTVMYSNFDDKDQEYLIVVDTRTGERIRIEFEKMETVENGGYPTAVELPEHVKGDMETPLITAQAGKALKELNPDLVECFYHSGFVAYIRVVSKKFEQLSVYKRIRLTHDLLEKHDPALFNSFGITLETFTPAEYEDNKHLFAEVEQELRGEME